MAGRSRRLLIWLFIDRDTGRIVIGQVPNLPMWIFLASLAASFLVPEGRAAAVVRLVQVTALGLWALDEFARGVNPWRRILGLATLTGIAIWLWLRR